MRVNQVQATQATFADLASSTTTNQATLPVQVWGSKFSIQAKVLGTGSVAATVTPQVSNNQTDWIPLTALSLSGTTSDVDGVTIDAAWAYIRCDVTGISGTGATVTIFYGGLGA